MVDYNPDKTPDSVVISRLLSDRKILLLNLNRPNQANALNEEMYSLLDEALGKAQSDKAVKSIVIQSTGRYFCAGADIKEYEDLDSTVAAQIRRDNLYKALHAILCSSKPVIAALKGPAIGGGLMLALACDEIIASDEAWISMPEVKLGFPSPIGIALLNERSDRDLVYRIVQLGERLSPAQALDGRIFSQIASMGSFDDVLLKRAESYQDVDSYAYMRNKSWINRSIVENLKQSHLFASGRVNF